MKKDIFSIVTSDKNPIYFLLDTNFLLDSLRHPKEYQPVIKSLLDNGKNSFLTIDPVLIEYYKGCNSKEDIKIKKEAEKSFGLTTLPTDKDIIKNALELSLIYMQNGKDVSVTDYYLGGALMKYSSSNTYLLSRDHKDFPSSIFNKEAFLVVNFDREIQTHILYSFDQAKYRKKASSLL